MDKDELREILDAKLDPIVRILEDHETILRGQSKRNGLIGDVNKVRWFSFGGLSALFWKLYDWVVQNG